MIIIYILCLVSIITFILFGLDKRRAVTHNWRIPEKTLLICSLFGGIGGFLGMIIFHHKTRKWKLRILVPLFAIVNTAVMVFLIWSSVYYHVDETALHAMQSDNLVNVERTDSGWLFDGPSEKEAFIFYPGAKVEEKAYAPLLRRLAEEEMDVYLVKMPFRLAFFGINKAGAIMETSDYDRYYIGGHSLGGTMAAYYAAKHERDLAGVLLFAAYPTEKTALDTLLIYGSEDSVLNMDRVSNAKELVSGRYREVVIDGGNHAQFGDYGKQKGDGTAKVTPDEQQSKTVEEIRLKFR